MGKTSNTVKDRWNRQNYDSLLIRLPKGKKERIQNFAQSVGESVNGFINRAIDDAMRDENKTDSP